MAASSRWEWPTGECRSQRVFFGEQYQNAIDGDYPIIKVIALVAEHYGLVGRMKPYNAEAERSGLHVTEASSLEPGSWQLKVNSLS